MLTRFMPALFLICLICGASAAQSAFEVSNKELVLIGESDQSAYEDIPAITLSVSNMELSNVVQFLASLSKTKIEVDPNFSRSKVTCDFKGETFAAVMANIALQVRGDVYWKDGKTKTFYFKPQPLNARSKK